MLGTNQAVITQIAQQPTPAAGPAGAADRARRRAGAAAATALRRADAVPPRAEPSGDEPTLPLALSLGHVAALLERARTAHGLALAFRSRPIRSSSTCRRSTAASVGVSASLAIEITASLYFAAEIEATYLPAVAEQLAVQSLHAQPHRPRRGRGDGGARPRNARRLGRPDAPQPDLPALLRHRRGRAEPRRRGAQSRVRAALRPPLRGALASARDLRGLGCAGRRRDARGGGRAGGTRQSWGAAAGQHADRHRAADAAAPALDRGAQPPWHGGAVHGPQRLGRGARRARPGHAGPHEAGHPRSNRPPASFVDRASISPRSRTPMRRA